MDNLRWDNNNIPSIFRNSGEIAIPPTTANIWSNYKDDHLSESDTDYCIVSSKAELNESLFNSSFEQLQGDLINVDRINEVAEMLAPTFDSMSNTSLDLDLLLQQQDTVRLAADSVVSSHHHQRQLVSFPATVTARPRIALDPLGSITENFGAYQELHIFASAKNDYTDGAVSVTFPSGESDNICNNNSSGKYFSSSGESAGSSQAKSLKNRRNCKRKLEDRHSSENLPLSTSSTSPERGGGGGGGFQIFFGKSPKSKKPRSEKESSLCSNIDFRQESGKECEPDTEAIAGVKEMIYRAAAMRPVSLVLEEAVEKPKRKNVKISSDPQTVAARHRRERISERLRVLQKMVPGGSKMDTASMLDEAANYLKFLKSQVSALETLGTCSNFSPFPFNHHQQQQAFPMQSTALFAHHPKP